jgi:hypothetical protein
MARDWSGRDAALKFFQKTKYLDDSGHYAEAINALRRSQDHTAIERKLKDATRLLQEVHMCAHAGTGLCDRCKASVSEFLATAHGVKQTAQNR